MDHIALRQEQISQEISRRFRKKKDLYNYLVNKSVSAALLLLTSLFLSAHRPPCS